MIMDKEKILKLGMKRVFLVIAGIMFFPFGFYLLGFLHGKLKERKSSMLEIEPLVKADENNRTDGVVEVP
ncbi:hypothetical protein ES702_02971 [subsurface metagenome]